MVLLHALSTTFLGGPMPSFRPLGGLMLRRISERRGGGGGSCVPQVISALEALPFKIPLAPDKGDPIDRSRREKVHGLSGIQAGSFHVLENVVLDFFQIGFKGTLSLLPDFFFGGGSLSKWMVHN